MQISLLGSGSRGNSTLIKYDNYAFLIDAGLSRKQIIERLSTHKISPTDLSGIILTHEHIDHIRSAGSLAKKWNLPIWTNRGTIEGGKKFLDGIPEYIEIEVGKSFSICGLRTEPFTVPHDAADPFGLIFTSENGYRIGFATDMGFATRLANEKLKGIQGLVLEFNHDSEMLLNGQYPWTVKQRIKSKLGHLNNEEAGILLKKIGSQELEWIVCAHISKENNSETLIMKNVNEALKNEFKKNTKPQTKVCIATQDKPTELFGFI